MSDNIFDAVPSYLTAVDTHNINNGNGSMLDPDTWINGASNIFKFTAATAVRAGVSTANIVPTVGNWFGADIEKISTENVLNSLDSDLGKYYQQHQTGIDITGDIISSFVPGLAGVKFLNVAQKGLALAAEGRAGYGISQAFGLLPDKAQGILGGLGRLPTMATEYGAAAASTAANSGAALSWLNSNTIASLAAGYGQLALENTAFLIAAETAMHDSPMFSDMDAKNIAYNALLGGGLVGGGIMGSLAAARTYGAIKKASSAADITLNPHRTITQIVNENDHATRILAGVEDLRTSPALPAEADPLYNQAFRLLDSRNGELKNRIYASANALAGGKNAEVGNAVADSIMSMKVDDAWNNIPGLVGVAKVTAPMARVVEGEESKLSTTWLKLHGGGANTAFETAPAKETLSLADSLKNPTESQILEVVSKYKFAPGDTKTPLISATAQEAEARYIAARGWSSEALVTTALDRYDIPAIEQAYMRGLSEIEIKGIGQVQLTASYMRTLKDEVINALGEFNIDMSLAEIAKRANVSLDYVQGVSHTTNPMRDLFAMQTADRNLTQQLVDAGVWQEAKGTVNAWARPEYVRLTRDLEQLGTDLDGNVLKGMQYITQRQQVQQQAVDNIFADYMGEKTNLFVQQIPAKLVLDVTRHGAGAGIASSSNQAPGTLGSIMEYLGLGTSKVEQAKREVIADRFLAVGYALKNDEAAKLEFAKVYQQLLQTPEKYGIDAAGKLKNIKLLDYEAATSSNATLAAIIDERAPREILIQSPAVREFLATAMEHNAEYLAAENSYNKVTAGVTSNLRGDIVYMPPPNPKQFKHYAFVVDNTVTGTGHVKMIWANSAQELEGLAERVPTEFKTIFQSDIQRFKEAQQKYEYSAGINDNYFDAAFARKGVAAPFFPKTDGGQVFDDYMAYANNRSDKQVRDFVYAKYAKEFKQLEDYGDQYSKLELSAIGKGYKYAESEVNNPYLNNIKTALNLSTYSEIPLLSQANRLAETAVTGLTRKIGDAWNAAKGTPTEKLDAINDMLKESGISPINYDSALNALANHKAPAPVLLNFVRKANSIFGTLMLRADPMNAANNGIGANVLLSSETVDRLARLRKFATPAEMEAFTTRLPGTGDVLTSAPKVIATAYGDYRRYVMGDPAMAAEFKVAEHHGWISTLQQQIKSIEGNLAPDVNDTAGILGEKITKAANWMDKNIDVLTGNRSVEDMNRFVAYRAGKAITDLERKYGLIAPELVEPSINSFINRTQGNYLASQRPLMFQGPIGQAIGLFQTYQFNMLQQFFRYVADGNKSSAATLMGMQGSIYGMNGLPAFNAINTHIVGMAAGNTTNQDLYSATYDVAGKTAGDWLLYGAGSNMLGLLHPDLKTNLYSRGDINPRQITVVPTNLADLPIAGAAAGVYNAIKNTAQSVAAGGNAWESLLRGIEHSQISRPLAGLAQVMEATANPQNKVMVTDSKGSLVAANDLYTIASFSRLLGARPMDEAIMRDATYRVSLYKEARNAEIGKLGSAIRTAVDAGESPSTEQMNKFMAEYAARGGNLQNFNKFYVNQILKANKAASNTMIEHNKSPGSQYMQRIMGDYRIQDFTNTPDTDGGQ